MENYIAVRLCIFSVHVHGFKYVSLRYELFYLRVSMSTEGEIERTREFIYKISYGFSQQHNPQKSL